MYSNNQGTRQRVQGNWTCAECGTQITSLPFEPDPNRVNQLKCSNCHSKSNPRRNNSERQTVKGDWTCSKCGTDIKELRFNPDPARLDQLKCSSCYIQGKPQRTGNTY